MAEVEILVGQQLVEVLDVVFHLEQVVLPIVHQVWELDSSLDLSLHGYLLCVLRSQDVNLPDLVAPKDDLLHNIDR